MDDEIDVARVLSRLEVPAAPSSVFSRRLRQRIEGELAMEAPAVNIAPAHVASFPTAARGATRPWPTRPGRSLFPALITAVCVLAVAAFYLMVVSQAAAPTRQGSTGADYELYTVAGSLTRIDPTTLADVEDQPEHGAPLDTMEEPMAASADGSVIAMVRQEQTDGQTTYRVSVIETRTGTERTSIGWKYPVESLDLSVDGSRLVLGTMSGTMELGPGWHLYDTGSGRLIGQVKSGLEPGMSWVNVLRTRIDSTGQRLYRLMAPITYMAADPSRQERLMVDDLVTGEPIGRVELPRLRSGLAPFPAGLDSDVFPGIALAPDGKQIALVHADDERVTLMDAERLIVERTIDLKRAESAFDRTLAWMGIMPRVASAKGRSGVDLTATFRPDGRYLYVWDRSPVRMSPEGNRLPTDRRGLQVIDLATGTILHEAFAGTHILDVVPTPGGDALFVNVATGYDDRGNPNAFTLWRLDSDLNRIAERSYTVEPHIVIATA